MVIGPLNSSRNVLGSWALLLVRLDRGGCLAWGMQDDAVNETVLQIGFVFAYGLSHLAIGCSVDFAVHCCAYPQMALFLLQHCWYCLVSLSTTRQLTPLCASRGMALNIFLPCMVGHFAALAVYPANNYAWKQFHLHWL